MNREIQYIEVVVPLSLPFATLTYLTQEKVSVGCRVLVSIGKAEKEVVGLVWALRREQKIGFSSEKIKPVVEVLDQVPLVTEREIGFVEWFSAYYIISLSDTLRTLAPQLFSKEMSNQSSRWSLTKLRKSRKAALLAEKNDKEGENEEKKTKDNLETTTKELPFDLSATKGITLLHTKQEVDLVSLVSFYLNKCSEGATKPVVLVVAPTAKMCSRVAAELESSFRVAVVSSLQSSKKRARVSLDMAVGVTTDVVVGTRTALLLQYSELAAVIVLDEHSYHYKSYRAPIFSLRDAAIVLGTLHKVQTLLISPYPSVESYYNARRQQGWSYIGDSDEQRVEYSNYIVLERGKEMISKYAVQEIRSALEGGKRAVVMQNRRGVASYVECDICSHTPQCPNCSTSLTLHQHLLGCHYCGYSKEIELRCSECGGVMRRRGRGTQQLESQLEELFPEARVVRFDADSMSEMARMRDSESWNIAVGTLLVIDTVDWSRVSVAVIANVDNLLSTPNFRASEDAFRVVGRMALMSSRVGAKLVVQSSRLDYDAVNLALKSGDLEFYNREIAERGVGSFPPHSRMLKVEFRGKQLREVMEIAVVVEKRLRDIFGDRLSPLHQPMVERQRGEHLVDLLLKVGRDESVVEAKRRLCMVLDELRGEARRRSVLILVEVDPS